MPELDRRTFLKTALLAACASSVGAVSSKPLRLPVRKDFSFLHSYESTGQYWKGIEKAGLIRETTGVRLVNSPFGSDDRRFNTTAAKGRPLHGILREHKCRFVIDRVVGGSPYCDYAFDRKLIDEYEHLLGKRFLGGQVHEVISNVHNDWNRFKKVDADKARRPIDPKDFEKYFDWSDEKHWLEYGTLEDYRGRSLPANEAELWKDIEKAVRRQGARFGGRFSYAEGTGYGELAWPAFYGYGAVSCFVEVGPWASHQTQFAIASARGASRAAGKPWGVFYAPWGPDGCTSWVEPVDSSWQAPRQTLDQSGWPVGPGKGPSSAFQRRVFFHTYLSGAHTLHEEWGAEGNLLKWGESALSSYGKVTRDLLDFQKANPDVGEPFTPIALLADAQFPPDAKAWAPIKDLLFKPSQFDEKQVSRASAGKAEAVCYSPMALPEVFDIVPGDASHSLLKQYQKTISVNDKDAPKLLADAVSALCPFSRTTNLSMQINHRASDGAWIVGLYNPWGAVRGDVEETGSVLDGECVQRETLRTKDGIRELRVLHAWPENTSARCENAAAECVLGPGGTLVLEIKA